MTSPRRRARWVALGLIAIVACAASPRRSLLPAWRSLPRDVRAVSDSIAKHLARETGFAPQRSVDSVGFYFIGCNRPSARITLEWSSDSLRGREPFDVVDQDLPKLGWVQDVQHGGDGPDGTFYGFTRGRLLLVIEGRWDGGDGTDSTYVPDPGKTLFVDVTVGLPCPGALKD